jgi:hypothetical protein
MGSRRPGPCALDLIPQFVMRDADRQSAASEEQTEDGLPAGQERTITGPASL